MFNEVLDLGEKVLKYCSKKGMESTEIYFSYNNQKQVLLEGQGLGTQRVNEELGAGIRIIHEGAEGFSYTNIMSKEALLKAADEAFSIAKLSPKIECIGFAEKQAIKFLEGVYNKELANLDIGKVIDDALDSVKGFTSVDSNIRTTLSTISLSNGGVAIQNSNGVNLSRKFSSYQAGIMAVASKEGKSGAMVSDSVFSRKHDIDFHEFCVKLGQRAMDSFNQELISDFDGPIIFRENAMLSPIGIVTSLAVSGDWRQRGTSFWKDKLGDKVANENFKFVERPFDLSGGGGVKAFDAEGNPTKNIDIVKDGVLQTFLHNQRTANKEKLQPTGNAVRTGGALPSFAQKPIGIFPNSPWILAGDMTEDEMIADTKKGLIIHNYQGTIRHQNGIFSGVAKGAYLIENGEITKPVTGISISGNVFDLINNISGVGKEYYLAGSILTTPIMRFEGIKVSTK
ncbi:MAG: TldD/PmbA family protein [Candidatus Heimdallarchaeaceae archaeon]|jgi:PmbA protein